QLMMSIPYASPSWAALAAAAAPAAVAIAPAHPRTTMPGSVAPGTGSRDPLAAQVGVGFRFAGTHRYRDGVPTSEHRDESPDTPPESRGPAPGAGDPPAASGSGAPPASGSGDTPPASGSADSPSASGPADSPAASGDDRQPLADETQRLPAIDQTLPLPADATQRLPAADDASQRLPGGDETQRAAAESRPVRAAEGVRPAGPADTRQCPAVPEGAVWSGRAQARPRGPGRGLSDTQEWEGLPAPRRWWPPVLLAVTALVLLVMLGTG